ncbi:4-hydroxy-tetrahydrodipicolinate synthase [Candidatus Hydrogenedentota bacterium]
MFSGSIVAMATPFRNGEIDNEKIEELVEFHIEKGTNALLPCGCTGEAATMSHEEQKDLIAFVVGKVNKRVPVIAGTGSNNTKEAEELTKFAKETGADAALVITPYYNKPTPAGQIAHYTQLAKVGMPIMLYNVPSRTGISLSAETVATLSEVENIMAIKEAGGSVEAVCAIKELCDITVMSGDDALTIPMMSVGATGVVSVAANIVPDRIAALVKSFADGDIETAAKEHIALYPLVKNMFIETNPLPVKKAMELMGLIDKAEYRMPLVSMLPENVETLRAVLSGMGLI